MKRIFIALSEIRPAPLGDSNVSAHFKAGSALSEFMAGRLGAPGCWLAEDHPRSNFLRGPDEVSSIQRWENEGGKTIAVTAPAKALTFGIRHFHPTQPLLTQLL